MKMTLKDILQATGGFADATATKTTVKGVSTDSRTLKKGDLFVALRGPSHDGHHYLREVFQKGAFAAVVERAPSDVASVGTLILVKDTLRALGDLAHFWRMKFSIPVVAITGSNGKTTTKEMTAAILAAKFKILKTEGNFNNLIGLPLTLFRLDSRAQAAVLEMGMNHAGEIDRLSEIAEPDVGLVTNIARAHLENFEHLSQVARAKGELLARLPRTGTAVLNADDPYFKVLKRIARGRRMISFGSKVGVDVRLLSSRVDGLKGLTLQVRLGNQKASFRLPVPGQKNAINALAAIAVGDHFGIPVKKMQSALAAFRMEKKRMEIVRLGRGIDLINDCYNANPDSMAASLDFLKAAGGGRRRVAVLGEMLELGSRSAGHHRETGARVARAGVSLLFAVGNHARQVLQGACREGLSSKSAFEFKTVESMARPLKKALHAGDLVLIKGSRGMKMERITQELLT